MIFSIVWMCIHHGLSAEIFVDWRPGVSVAEQNPSSMSSHNMLDLSVPNSLDALKMFMLTRPVPHGNKQLLGAVKRISVPRRSRAVAARIDYDEDDVLSRCYGRYTVGFLRECLLNDGCKIPDECDVLTLEDLNMVDGTGRQILNGRSGEGTMRSTKTRSIEPKKKRRTRKDKPIEQNSARALGLALALDQGTRKSHSMAESSQFIKGFFKGLSTRVAFSQLVASLYFVYQAMEEEFDKVDERNVKLLDYPELRRLPSLEQDMEYYFGERWKSIVVPSHATQEYCNRIRTIARDQPHLMIAHMYARYIGDLFGGQLMRGMARTSLKLDKGKGTRFYEFDDITHIKKFIEAWYTRLNELHLSDEQKKEIVNEANYVFALNICIFQEISGSKAGALRLLLRLIKAGIKIFAKRVKGKLQVAAA